MLTQEDLQNIRGAVREELVSFETDLEPRLAKNVTTQVIAEVVSKVVAKVVPQVVAEVVPKIITEAVPKIVAEVVPKVTGLIIEQVAEMIEQNILPQIEEIRQELRYIKTQMVTRLDLEERLGSFRLTLRRELI